MNGKRQRERERERVTVCVKKIKNESKHSLKGERDESGKVR